MPTTLIKNGTVYDGLGSAPYQADLLLEGCRIARISPRLEDSADQVIDAAGLAVTPGFVDIHRHCDIKPFRGEPAFGDAELAQGITTVVTGNCGITMTPCNPVHKADFYAFTEPVLGRICPDPPSTFPAYMAALDQKQLPFHMASMIGTGSVKISVKGFADTPFTHREMEAARGLLEEAMQQGAPGVSMGIMYLPECYSTTEEFACLLEPVGRYGGILTAHIRGEGDSLVKSVAEAIEIGKQAGCPVEISHFKSAGVTNWRDKIYRAIEVIETARAAGQDVTCDFYPYDGGSTALTTMIPPAFVAGDMQGALRRLGTAQGVDSFRRACAIPYPDWDNYCITLGWGRILISGVTKARNRQYVGKTVETCALEHGFSDAAAFAAHLLHDEQGKVAIISMSMCQEDIDTVARLPYSLVISDSIYADTDTPHPRMYGSFPKIIREYVVERGVYTLTEAVARMSGRPARRMGLEKRGQLAEGFFADINVFDPSLFRDNADYTHSTRLATGLAWCLVNGKIAIEAGRRNGENHGRNLRIRR